MKPRFIVMQSRSVFAVVAVSAVVGVAGTLASGCEIKDNVINIPNATINATTTVDVENVMPEQTIPITMTVPNVYLIAPEMTPPPAEMERAGHIRIYIDDVAKPPLLITAEVNVMVTIPMATPPGKHKLICRVHKHDGTPTSTKQEIEINVKATVTTSPDGGVSVDANVSTDVNVTTDTGTAG